MLEAALAAQAANVSVCVWTQQGVDLVSSLKSSPSSIVDVLGRPVSGSIVSVEQLACAEKWGYSVKQLLEKGLVRIGTLQCLKEHVMTTRLAEATYTCDMCNEDIADCEPLFDCRECDFCACVPCAAAQLKVAPTQGALNCPLGHPMVQQVANYEFVCDKCGCDIKIGESLLDCRACDHSVCIGWKCQYACHMASLGRQSTNASESDLCVVCLAAPRTHAFVPCGHRCVCEPCGYQVKKEDRACPICRCENVKLMRIWD